MDSRVKHVFDGLSVVAIGLVFLGNTLGIIDWSVWLNILSLWPLLLVAAGIDLVGKSLDSGWVRTISSLVFIGGIAYAVFVMPVDGWPGTFGLDLGQREAVAFEGAEGSMIGLAEADARIKSPVGRLDVESGAANLIEWSGRSSYGEPRVDVSEEGSSAVVSVDFERGRGFVFGSTRGSETTLRLNRGVAWALKLDSAVGELDADLSDLEVSRLEIDSGVGSGTIKLGDPAVGGEVDIESGVASLNLLLPDDAEARVRFQSGIGGRDLPPTFERTSDGTYETSGFVEGGAVWDVVVQSGIGNLEVDTY